jgi:peroxiredoxin (alkyl hydroperoxide reductase subunit C)
MRRFNWPLLAAFVLMPVAFLSFPLFFVKWPITRDVPWASVLLFAIAGLCLFNGVRRAFAPGRFRALKIAGSLAVTALSALCLYSFGTMVFIGSRHLPASTGAPQVGQQAPDFTLLDEHGKSTTLSEILNAPVVSVGPIGPIGQGSRPRGVLLIFYMYSGCRACNSELHDMQKSLPALLEAGIRPVAISIDPPDESRRLSQEAGYTFTFLSDPALSVSRRYDVVMSSDGARPAEFLLDKSGIVRWRNLTTNYYVRARPEEILQAAKTLR